MKKRSLALALALTLLVSLLLTAFASAAAEGADRAFIIENLYAVEYDGNYQKPKPLILNGSGTVLTEGTHYTLTFADNRNAGTATITITGRGDYGAVTVNGERLPAVTATAQFEIMPRELYVAVDSVTVRAGEQPKFSYSLVSGKLAGSDKLPTPSYRLYERTADTRGVTVDFGADANKNYRIHITDGVLTYIGTEEPEPTGGVTFGKLGAVTYNGKAQTPEPVLTAANGVTLRKDVDYTRTYSNNVNAGTASVRILGKGGYAGTLDKTLTFEIKPAPITVKADNVRCRMNSEPDEFDYSITSGKVYNGDDIGDVTIKAVSRSGYSYGPVFDLKVTVKNRNPNYEITTKNGTMTFTDVDGDDTYYYRDYDSEGLHIQKIAAVDYDGTYQEPEVTVKNNDGDVLREGTDYRLTYSDNLHAGTATVTAIGKGAHSGEHDSRTFTIRKRDVTVTVNDAVVFRGETYSGTYSVYPRLCSGDSLGKESWTQPNTSRLGTYTVSVSFAGNKDYSITVKSGKLTVVEPQPTKTALGTPRTMTTASISNPYRDVRSGVWYEEPALFCHANGVLFGTSVNTFSVGGSVTRAQIVTALYRMNGSPRAYGETSFLDVVRGSWYEDAVTWASQNGIVNGKIEYLFAPNDPITREEFCTILYRYAKANSFSVSQTAKLGGYTDQAKVSDYAREAVIWAVGARVLTLRVKDALDPGLVANRAELAMSLQLFAETYLTHK